MAVSIAGPEVRHLEEKTPPAWIRVDNQGQMVVHRVENREGLGPSAATAGANNGIGTVTTTASEGTDHSRSTARVVADHGFLLSLRKPELENPKPGCFDLGRKLRSFKLQRATALSLRA